MLTLNFIDRSVKENTEKLRKSGNLPAVFYGRKTGSSPISVSLSEFLKVWKEVGESSVISLVSDKKKYDALINDVALHPVTDRPVHADFYVLEKGQKVEVSIPLVYIGESPAVKSLGGVLVKVIHELDVEAEAANLPNEISVDIGALIDFDSRITVADLKLPDGVVAQIATDEVVAIAVEAKEETEEAAPAIDISDIEVEKKGKEESDGEETATSE